MVIGNPKKIFIQENHPFPSIYTRESQYWYGGSRISSFRDVKIIPGIPPLDPRLDRIPKRRKISKQVTQIERRMRTMMIHVSPADLRSNFRIDVLYSGQRGLSKGDQKHGIATYGTFYYRRSNLTESPPDLEKPCSARSRLECAV